MATFVVAVVPHLFMRPFYRLLPSEALDELTALVAQLQAHGRESEARDAERERALILRIINDSTPVE